MWSYLKSLVRGLSRPAFVFLFFLAFTLMLLLTGLLYVSNPQTHFGVQSFVDIFYFVVSTMAGVGIGDITPRTPLAKLFTAGIMLMGTAVFVSFTGMLASLILEVELNSRGGRDEDTGD